MPEPHRHRHHSHSRKPRRKLRVVDIILLLWSLISLISFLFLLDRVETAPVWQVAFLAASTLIGIIVFFSLVFRSKK